MKKSSYIQLVLMSSSLVFLSACDQKPEGSSLDQEKSSLNQPSPPTYMNKEECERTHGEGKCNTKLNESGTGSVFMPMIAGYMLGSLLNKSTSSPSVAAAPSSTREGAQRGGFGGQAKKYFNAGG
jgi:uncharacterized protein YgiB involved in biofilm formation